MTLATSDFVEPTLSLADCFSKELQADNAIEMISR